MAIIVSPHNKEEERVLRAFLNILEYEYSEEENLEIPPPSGAKRQTLEEYNLEIENAVAEIESGNYYTHEEVVKESKKWRKNSMG